MELTPLLGFKIVTMKNKFLFFASFFVLIALGLGADTKDKLLHATLLEELDGDLTSKFGLGTPKIYALWKGDATLPNDTVRSVWIADDIGTAAPRNSKIDEASVVTRVANEGGVFLLSKPEKGWAPGKYRLELYV